MNSRKVQPYHLYCKSQSLKRKTHDQILILDQGEIVQQGSHDSAKRQKRLLFQTVL